MGSSPTAGRKQKIRVVEGISVNHAVFLIFSNNNKNMTIMRLAFRTLENNPIIAVTWDQR